MFFKKEATYIFDVHSLSDGRIARIVETGFIKGKFILMTEPFWNLARPTNFDQTSRVRINENVKRITDIHKKHVTVISNQLTAKQFLQIAKRSKAIIVTTTTDVKDDLYKNFPELNAIGAQMIVLNDLYEILKPDYLPGTELKIVVSKKGKEIDEGIGYLESGTKVVIAGGAKSIGKEIEVIVQGSLETTVGKLIFARPKYVEVQ